MSEALFSSSWYRVKDLTPRLRPHTQVHRHIYRGEPWYVLQDASRSSYHRFTPTANLVIGLLDGRRTVDTVWQLVCDELGDDAPTQDQMIRLLGQLHAADILQHDVSPDVLELFDRWKRQETQQWVGRLISPLAIRIGLIDPERFLAKTIDVVRPLFSWLGMSLWLAVVVPAVVLAVMNWEELTYNVLDTLFTPANLVMIWALFPVIKILHELGHGYATKNFGGEVHDMGIMFLVFTPVPYVDASAAWRFPSKYHRALVGAGGMLAEIFVAAIAFYVWLGAEAGAVRAVAHNVVVIAGTTTLLFNLNPLLRFDGYYILSDLIEIPNLRQRSSKYFGALVERYGLGRKDTKLPETVAGEPAWFVSFCVAAFVYRLFIVVAILMWILDQFLILGILLGAAAGFGWLGVPLWRATRFLFTGVSLRGGRTRALTTVGGALFAIALLLFVVPFPLRTQAEGVIWLPADAFVRSNARGFVERVIAQPGDWVEPGSPLFQMSDSVLETEVKVLDARVRELEASYRTEYTRDRYEAEVTLDALRYAQEDLARARERFDELLIRSKTAGWLVVRRSADLAGRFVRKGQPIGSVVDLDTVVVRAVVPQDDIDLVRLRTRAVKVRFAQSLSETHDAQVRRIVPAATNELPSMALSIAGGGTVPIDPSEKDQVRAAQSLFQVEIALPPEVALTYVGARAYVRFDHGTEPLGIQWYRRVRQLFLSRLHV